MPELDPNRWKSLTIVCAAFFMTVLDVSIVNVALPSIGKSLHFSEEGLQWVITAYAITFGGFLLLGGRAADLLGRRRVFFVGVAVFTIASFLCGLAWSEGVLIGARAVQGLGAAIITPAALSIITTTLRRGRRAEQGARHLGRDRRLGRRGRRARWRRAHEVPRLGVDLLRQRAGRCARSGAGAALRAREPFRPRALATTSAERSRSPPGSRCSSTPSRRRRSTAGRTSWTIIAARRRGGPADRVPRDRVAREGSADAVPHLPGAHGRRRERRGPPARRGIVFANFFLLTLYVQNVLGWSALKTGLTFVATAGTAILWAGRRAGARDDGSARSS